MVTFIRPLRVSPREWIVVVLVLVVLFVVVGCVSGAAPSRVRELERVEPQPTAKFLADVYARTAAAATARYAWELRSVSGSNGAAEGSPDGVVLMREQGVFDRVEQRLSSETVLFEPDGRANEALRVVIDGDVLYLQPGFLAAGFGLGQNQWIGTSSAGGSVPRDDVPGSSSFGANATAAVGPRGIGVSGLLRPVLLEVTGEVTIVGEVGATRIRGEPTTHLRAHVAGSALAAAMPAVTATGNHMGRSDSVVIDTWVDADGRLRRIEASVGEIVLRVDVYDYDESVELHEVVDIPEQDRIVASDVELLSQLLARFGAG